MSDDNYNDLAELFGAVQRWLGAWHRAMNYREATNADADLLRWATEDLYAIVAALLAAERDDRPPSR